MKGSETFDRDRSNKVKKQKIEILFKIFGGRDLSFRVVKVEDDPL